MKRSFLLMLLIFVALQISPFRNTVIAQMDQMQMSMPKTAPAGQVPVMLTPQKQKLVGVQTQTVRQKVINKVVYIIGRVDYNERTLRTVTTKIEGWIENMTVDARGMSVKKGSTLFSVYSPKLLQTQEEYLLAFKAQKRTGAKGRNLASASRKRLALWDVSPQQIRDLEKRGKVTRAFPVLSPASGIVIEKMALTGMYVKPGMPLYKIADLSTVWVLADIYEHELPWVKIGQIADITLTALPGRVFQGEINYIYPYMNENSRTATLRIALDNQDGLLKPGMYADVKIVVPAEETLVIAESAVLDSGLRQVVFIAKPGGIFEPRLIKIGRRIHHEVQVLEGLSEGEEVVTHGTFLIDSESKLNASMEGMMGLVGMGDWKMEGSRMGGMDGMDMRGMNMDTSSSSMNMQSMEKIPEKHDD